MDIDGRHLPHKQILTSDVVIIGGGAAGLTIAHELLGSGLSLIVVESGHRRGDRQVQSLNAGEVLSGSPHPPADMYRERRLGGSSTIWGGRCIPFDRLDLEKRDHVPFSGWPIDYSQLEPYYERALEYCEAGEWDSSTEAVGSEPHLIRGYDSSIFEVGLERYSPPTNFGRRYGRVLSRATDAKVVLNATCIELVPAPESNTIAGARFKTFAGNEFEVRSKLYVIATGGLEVVRLLGASRRRNLEGMANSSGLLGRYYMCHVEGAVGVLNLNPKTRPIIWNFERTRDGIYARRRLRLRDEQQRKHQTLNMIFRLHHPNSVDPSHQDPVLSLMYLAKRFVLPEYRRKIASVELSALDKLPSGKELTLHHLRNVLADVPRLSKFLMHWSYARHASYRRIPYVALYSSQGRYPLEFNSEQFPNPDSKVSLTETLDPLGVPRIRIDWRLCSDDVRSIATTYRLLRQSIEAAGVGTVEFSDETLEDRIRECGPVGGHHIGTARMDNNPKLGVVDEHCRTHDVENLYIASSAVFPTCSHANPTLTILALSLRLAQELRRRLVAGPPLELAESHGPTVSPTEPTAHIGTNAQAGSAECYERG